MYKIGLPSGKSIFQLHSEYLRKLEKVAAKNSDSVITFIILTSKSTNSQIKEFFEENSFFGLKKQNVFFTLQDDLPSICLTTGNFLKISKNEYVMSPAGNGNVYDIIFKNNIYSLLEKRNIKYIHIFGVDNVLTRVADPLFIGFLISKNLSCAMKVIVLNNRWSKKIILKTN